MREPIASKQAILPKPQLHPPNLTSPVKTGKPLAAQLDGLTGAIVAILGVKVPSGAMATTTSYHPIALAGDLTAIGGKSSALPAAFTWEGPSLSCAMALFALPVNPSILPLGQQWVPATVAKFSNYLSYLGDFTMLRFLFSLEMFGLIFLSGCSSDNKPIDQEKLQQEFNDLQKARQKEDPYAGKRK